MGYRGLVVGTEKVTIVKRLFTKSSLRGQLWSKVVEKMKELAVWINLEKLLFRQIDELSAKE